jgi:hypothetical protein
MTPIPTSHAGHDPLAVAAYAAGDATGNELDAALAQVAACEACAVLHHDLRAIALALPALPAPSRTRDFRLTPEQAASLRPSGWRRLLAPLAGPKFAFAGPLGTGLATLGVAGFLLAGAMGMPLAGSASAPQDGSGAGTGAAGASEYAATDPSGTAEKALEAASMAPALVPVDQEQIRTAGESGVPELEMPAADETPGILVTTNAGPDESMPAEVAPGSMPVPDATASDGTVPVLPLLSGVVLAAGLALVALRLAGRRLEAR